MLFLHAFAKAWRTRNGRLRGTLFLNAFLPFGRSQEKPLDAINEHPVPRGAAERSLQECGTVYLWVP